MKLNPHEYQSELRIDGTDYTIISLNALVQKGIPVGRMPFSIRVLLENILRNLDGRFFEDRHLDAVFDWERMQGKLEIPFLPGRILMQDFTGVPAVVDIASLRSEMARRGKALERIQPLIPVDVIIDHSLQVDYYGTGKALEENVGREYERNSERYRLLKWAQSAFRDFTVLPPGMGICHQVNLEYLAGVVAERETFLFPDTLVGTDSHTPMVNGAGVIGWGVGGIEAEAAMLGQPLYFTLPEVIGVELTGKLPVGTTATDLVLHITARLRAEGVVGKFVEFTGDGVSRLSVPDRATISNMSPEFGCTVSYFPIDGRTIEYLRLTGRKERQLKLVEAYARENLLWRSGTGQISYSRVIGIELGRVVPSLAGPKRPQDLIHLPDLKEKVSGFLRGLSRDSVQTKAEGASGSWPSPSRRPEDEGLQLPAEVDRVNIHTPEEGLEMVRDGSVVIAAITSCTNTSNPEVMLAAGLLAKRAVELGLKVPVWVKTSLAPGSKVVADYLRNAGLLPYLEALGFHIVGYGCTTCIGNSGDLPPRVDGEIKSRGLQVAAVLSGNRNFEARIHPDVGMNFLASPPLVIAFALAGRTDIDISREPLGFDPNGTPVFLSELWPDQENVRELAASVLKPELFRQSYSGLYEGDERWRNLAVPEGDVYTWDNESTYIREAPFFINLPLVPGPSRLIEKARVLLLLGDSVTTDHISPAGKFPGDSPAGRFLLERGVEESAFNTYGSRRGNHEVMMRGTFANVRLRNYLTDRTGGYTLQLPSGEEVTVWDASCEYRKNNTPLIILAGKEYGSGSSRDWAAKGTSLLGVGAVIAESYERIHRSNLIGMGVLPLQFREGQSWRSLGLTGREEYTIEGTDAGLAPGTYLRVTARPPESSGNRIEPIRFETVCRLDSEVELDYWRNGGVLNKVLRRQAQFDGNHLY